MCTLISSFSKFVGFATISLAVIVFQGTIGSKRNMYPNRVSKLPYQ